MGGMTTNPANSLTRRFVFTPPCSVDLLVHAEASTQTPVILSERSESKDLRLVLFGHRQIPQPSVPHPFAFFAEWVG